MTILDRPLDPAAAALAEARRQRRDTARARRRVAFARQEMAMYKAADAARVAVLAGCALLGWFDPATPLADILAVLARWAAEPASFSALPWPRRCCDVWEWEPGEQLAVWHAGRLLALVAKGPAGDVVTTRFDPDGRPCSA